MSLILDFVVQKPILQYCLGSQNGLLTFSRAPCQQKKKMGVHETQIVVHDSRLEFLDKMHR